MKTKKDFSFGKDDLMDEVFVAKLSFIKKILVDYKDYLGHSFEEVTDIELENLREFFIPILRAFSEEKISVCKLENIGSALETYIHRRYLRDFPDTFYPNFGEDHPLSVPLNIIDFLSSPSCIIFPEDAVFYIEMLLAPSEQALETNKKMYAFLDQFDTDKRYQEGRERGLFRKDDM